MISKRVRIKPNNLAENNITNFKNIRSLSLYHFQSCPFSAVTRRVIDETGLDVEQRDILLNPQHQSDLIAGGGKPQVPSLRIESYDGQIRWLYESADIIRFIRENAEHTEEVA